MVEATDQDQAGQNRKTMTGFMQRHGHMPTTVVAHKPQPNGVRLITSDRNPDTNIEVYDDE